MQEAAEACSLDDDMADGDLGDGTGVGAAPGSPRNKSHSLTSLMETLLPRTEPLGPEGEVGRIPGLKGMRTPLGTRWKLPHCVTVVLRCQVIDVLGCELEVAHRYVEGKYEALKILQGKAILDKATSHTKSLLQKSEAQAKTLEKEVNTLQWELGFNQVQMKKSQQSWEEKYNRLDSLHTHSCRRRSQRFLMTLLLLFRVLSENKSLSDNLEERGRVVQQLRAENSACSRQCLELLSMLSVKEQRAFQGSKLQTSLESDASVLELAVLGACRCLGAAEACPCSRAAAASRKQLVQMQQEVNHCNCQSLFSLFELISVYLIHNDYESLCVFVFQLDSQRLRREEASMVADAFRIAFEQQLRKRSDHFLLLADANILKSHHSKAEGANRSPVISVSRRLRGLLPSKTPDDLLETLYRLLDLLNDKDEALAHQRKVSIMLARSAEELHRRLRLDSHGGPAHLSEDHSPSPQTDAPESRGRARPEPQSVSESRTDPRELSDPSQCDIQPPPHHEADIRQTDQPESPS
ncbi:coiled-coil domain-containing protein 125 [Pungitius pungitius]|uniref:coiled-coil domain-containing protein 125 n=1 Tax=Pungitius pungitius TaxID=134920 RepID=UPI002E14BE62